MSTCPPRKSAFDCEDFALSILSLSLLSFLHVQVFYACFLIMFFFMFYFMLDYTNIQMKFLFDKRYISASVHFSFPLGAAKIGKT